MRSRRSLLQRPALLAIALALATGAAPAVASPQARTAPLATEIASPKAEMAPFATEIASPQAGTIAGISPAQRTRIMDHVRGEKRASSPVSPGTAIEAGSVLPDSIPLFWLHPEPGLSRFRYAVVNGRAVIVSPDSRQILGAVE